VALLGADVAAGRHDRLGPSSRDEVAAAIRPNLISRFERIEGAVPHLGFGVREDRRDDRDRILRIEADGRVALRHHFRIVVPGGSARVVAAASTQDSSCFRNRSTWIGEVIEAPQLHHRGQGVIAERQCSHVGDDDRAIRTLRDLPWRRVDTHPLDTADERRNESTLATTDVEYRALQLRSDLIVNVTRRNPRAVATGIVVIRFEDRHQMNTVT
jgi:hypothetical protein